MDKKRSKGVTFLGCWLIITGILWIKSNFFLLIQPTTVLDQFTQNYKVNPIILIKASGVIGVTSNVLTVILGVYILKLNEFCRKIAIYYFYFMAAYSFLSLFLLNIPNFDSLARSCSYFTTMAIFNLLFVYFLTRSKVIEQFS